MGYILALVLLIVVVPLLFMLLSRRTAGSGPRSRDHGMTVEQPSAEEATPGAPGSINQPAPGAERRLPPG